MALRDNPYLPLYVQDFLTDEKLAECSAESTGVYIRLMCLMHKSESYGTIVLKQKDWQKAEICYNKTPNNIETFANKLVKQLPYSEDVILHSLHELIEEGVLTLDGDILLQKRMVKDGAISEKRSKSGKKGMGSRYKPKKVVTDFDITNPLTNTDNESEYDNDNIIGTEKGGTGGKTKPKIPFAEVWDLYDKKRGDKTKLETKWNTLSRITQLAIIEYIPKYKASEPNKKFRKDFATFLNNHSWEDEIITDTRNGTQKDSSDIQRTGQSVPRNYNEGF